MKKRMWLVAILSVIMVSVVVGIFLYGDHKLEFSDAKEYPEITIIDHEIKTSVKPWEDPDTGLVHYFLPGGIKSDVVYRGDVAKKDLSVGGTSLNKLKISSDETFDLSYKGKEFKASFHVIPNMSSVFIDTKSGSMEKINEDKENTETGKMLSVSKDGKIEYYGKLEEIKGHGNVTWTASDEKKPYSIKLKDKIDIGDITDVNELLLLGLYYDGDKIHTKLALDLAEILDPKVAIRSTYINLYLNGEFMGLYLATEAPKKLEIFNSKDNEFLIEKDLYLRAMDEVHFGIESGDYFSVCRPKNPSEEFLKEMHDFIQEVDDNIRECNVESIDVESFAVQCLVQMMTQNNDAMRTSTFFYKMKDDNLLYAGPAWDFDGGFGEAYNLGETMIDPQGGVFFSDYSQLEWFHVLTKDDYFNGVITDILYEHVDEIDKLFSEGIDNYEKMLEEAYKAEDTRWKWSEIKEFYKGGHYKEWKNLVRFLRYYSQSRLEYMCSQYSVDYPTTHFEGNGEMHTVTFKKNGEEILKLTVKDGDMINPEDYPELQGIRWMFTYFEEVFYKNVPIFEDCELVPYIY